MAVSTDTITVTTASDGSATAYSGKVYNGTLLAIRYAKTDFANGVDFTITSETTGQTLWTQNDVNASSVVYPRTASHTTAGVATTYDGTRGVLVPVALVNERIKVQIASGGDTKTGAFTFAVEGY